MFALDLGKGISNLVAVRVGARTRSPVHGKHLLFNRPASRPVEVARISAVIALDGSFVVAVCGCAEDCRRHVFARVRRSVAVKSLVVYGCRTRSERIIGNVAYRKPFGEVAEYVYGFIVSVERERCGTVVIPSERRKVVKRLVNRDIKREHVIVKRIEIGVERRNLYADFVVARVAYSLRSAVYAVPGNLPRIHSFDNVVVTCAVKAEHTRLVHTEVELIYAAVGEIRQMKSVVGFSARRACVIQTAVRVGIVRIIPGKEVGFEGRGVCDYRKPLPDLRKRVVTVRVCLQRVYHIRTFEKVASAERYIVVDVGKRVSSVVLRSYAPLFVRRRKGKRVKFCCGVVYVCVIEL